MEYTALYRKYRPRDFQSLVGQEHIAATLQNALKQNRVTHAYLFTGPRGTGKTSVAHILSRAVNCENITDGEPCGQCEACLRILNAASMDVVEMDAASKRGIDDMRELLERVKYAPVQEKYKVYIIDEVHMLTNEAFNALLKTLEEPPKHLMFILATTEPHKVPVTIISRCQRFDFHRMGDIAIINHLKYVANLEGREINDDAVALIAKRAYGGMRDALGLLDQTMIFTNGIIDEATVAKVLGTASAELVSAVIQAVANGDIEEIIRQIDIVVNEGVELRQFLLQILDYLRDQVVLSAQGKTTEIDKATALNMLNSLIEADTRLKNSPLPRITLEIALLTSCNTGNNIINELTGAGATVKTPAKVVHEEVKEAMPKPIEQAKINKSGNAGLDFFINNWQDIVGKIRKVAPVPAAFLLVAEPSDYIDNLLTLAFPEKFKLHAGKVQDETNQARIEEILSQIAKREIKIAVKMVD